MQKDSYDTEAAYEYFRDELLNVLDFVFGQKLVLEDVGQDSTDEKKMLRYTIIAISHKIYLERCFSAISRSKNLDNQ